MESDFDIQPRVWKGARESLGITFTKSQIHTFKGGGEGGRDLDEGGAGGPARERRAQLQHLMGTLPGQRPKNLSSSSFFARRW